NLGESTDHNRVSRFTGFILNFGYRRRLAEAALDFVLVTAAYLGAFLIRLDFNVDDQKVAEILPNIPVVAAASYVSFFALGLYRGIWRYSGLSDVVRFANIAIAAGFLIVVASHFLPIMLSGSIAVLFVILLFNLLVASRLSFRAFRRGIAFLA